MKQIDTLTGEERNETRTEILARHSRMMANHSQGMDFLATIHGEIGDWAENEESALKEWKDDQDRLKDLGLVTEENTKKSIDDTTETMERIVALLRRHQHGYKDGFHRTEDTTGYNRHLREVAAGKVTESEE